MERQADADERARKVAKTTKSPLVEDDEAPEDDVVEDPPSKNPGAELTDWTFRKLISCVKSVIALKDPATKRRLSDVFLEKPPPQTFPDYYEIIEKPIAINDILRKCRSKTYVVLQEFRDDWKLMFANARKFNGDDSWVVKDGDALQRELERVLTKNGFADEMPPSPKRKKLRIKLSLKTLKSKPDA
jgi:ATP-dependent helicase STH1/SNF2